MCCLDPFGMLDPQVVVNLLPAPGVVDERSCRERTKWPSEGLPKGGTHVLAVCVTVQLDDCVALALQQHGEQSALRKGLGHNVVSFCFSFSKGWTIFAGIPFISADRFAMNLRRAFAREAIPQDQGASAWTAPDPL
jgi:hypothetical protein